MTQRGASLAAFSEFSRPAVAAVGVPVMILAGIATYFNSRASVARQSVEAAANPQTAMMNKLALYVFPLGVVVGGPFLPLAIIFYWFSNNIWTFGQQHYVFGMIEKEEEEKKREALERRSANAPAPGAKPKRSARNAAAATGSVDGETPATEPSEADTGNTDETPRNGNPGNRAPRPGAKPRKRKR
jgi:YidC/Oxa1 family membrane protein insertase